MQREFNYVELLLAATIKNEITTHYTAELDRPFPSSLSPHCLEYPG